VWRDVGGSKWDSLFSSSDFLTWTNGPFTQKLASVPFNTAVRNKVCRSLTNEILKPFVESFVKSDGRRHVDVSCDLWNFSHLDWLAIYLFEVLFIHTILSHNLPMLWIAIFAFSPHCHFFLNLKKVLSWENHL